MKRTSTWMTVRLGSAAFALAIIAAQMAPAQDFTVRMKDEDGKAGAHYVSRSAVRNVSLSPIETDYIYRLDQGNIIILNHKEKTYAETTMDEIRRRLTRPDPMKQEQQEMMRRLGMGGGISVTSLGAAEAIAGYRTEKYSVRTPVSQGEIWVAPDLEVPPGYYDMVTSYVAAEAPGLGQMFKEMKDKQVKGFLLKQVSGSPMPMMKGVTITRVAVSVEKGPIPRSTFEPPAGYRRVARAD